MPPPELRRVGALPPYVFAAINELKLELRRAGEDVVDLGFGNPDLPSPAVAVEKLREAAATRATIATRPAAASRIFGGQSAISTRDGSASSSTRTRRR